MEVGDSQASQVDDNLSGTAAYPTTRQVCRPDTQWGLVNKDILSLEMPVLLHYLIGHPIK